MRQNHDGGRTAPVFVLISFGLVGFSTVQADVYKWTDSSGRVQYTDRPTSNEARPVPGTGTRIDTSQAIRDLAEKELDFKKREEETAKAKEQADKEAEQARIKRQNCENARNKFIQLQSGFRLYTTAANGAKIYMNEAERQQALDNAQKAINQYCD